MYSKGVKKSFTLVELMIVIAILAILSAIVIFTLNPGRLFDNFRDTRRVTDITSIHKAINFMETWNTSMTYGTSTFVYISIPATNANCSDIAGLPTLPAGYTYACSSQANYKKTDGTGWIPINFTVSSDNRYLSNLPVDPVNDNTYFYTYFPGGSYELTTLLKNPNANSINSEGSMTGAFTIGSPNRTKETPLSRDTGLVGHWKFNEGTGTTVYDYSGFGNNGTWNGTGTKYDFTSTGKRIGVFNGTSDWIRVNSYYTDLTKGITALAWVKNISTPATMVASIVYKNGPYDVFISNNNRIYTWLQTSNLAWHGKSTGILTNDWASSWHLIVSTQDTSVLKIYKDGILVYTDNDEGTLVSSSSEVWIGRNSGGTLSNIYLDDVRIYNRALSAEEISQIYNATKSSY